MVTNVAEGLERLTEEQRANILRFGYTLIHRDPSIAKEARRLAAKADPTAYRFPELEAEETVKAELKSRDEKIAELETKQLEADARARIAERRTQAQEKGLDPKIVEDLIIERSKAGRPIDWDTAMEIVELQGQSAAATPASNQNPVAAKAAGWKEWFEDPAGTASREAHAAIDELRGRRRRTA